ncbi:GNAT family N-acetyltransferase [Lutibacter sp. HS1-25]|uniref:GNAT family N-acetyltransferase n=1 Tax=Lutibacter sp. HS1-25 TaxID=2485000 RepID=UPI0010120BD0|nr:GNAT family N-acetyltransferase [Lutibacter sp. HS1-25]RXP64639.1 GNAT family N-acetyltransferase [Lutibacter sp. HS1-25]
MKIRLALKTDLVFLQEMEEVSFEIFQRSSKESISKSIKSEFQEFYILETEDDIPQSIGVLVLFKYKKALRIYSISVLPAYQHKGTGNYLLNHAIELAKQQNYERVILEVYTENTKLIDWYKARGFKPLHVIEDYYEKGKNALKMEFMLPKKESENKYRNIIVINLPQKWTFHNINAKVITAKEYINNPIYHSNSDYRIFNLCSSYKYQTYGYYVSLLASARGQHAFPSITTIRDFRSLDIIRSVTNEIEELIATSLKKIKGESFTLHIYFGQTATRGFDKLAKKLHQLFETPFFKVHFIKHEVWLIKSIKVLNLNKFSEEEFVDVNEFTKKYFEKKIFKKSLSKTYKYDIAILVDPKEKTPPSCPKALQKFKMAANKRDVYLEFITKSDFDRINEFDGLFIRETTSVIDHTYEFSRMAYSEGLVVIDDPWSILKCSNKIFQNETFKKNKVLTPQTTVLTKNFFSNSELDNLNYPMVIKQPDSAFSIGVIKVENKEEALLALNDLFKKSDMVILQEYLYSDFDWRVGVIDNEPLFACKYYMSKGHWQIYNWDGKGEEIEGDHDTMPISEVPKIVLDTALKATALIGDGLYGVDLKMVDGKVYVIEVNDNPNIDDGVEDMVLGDAIYDKIIDVFCNRIENYKNFSKLISI